MENKQLETTGKRKPRISRGKLKKAAPSRAKRYSQGFSSSFTQKTLRNNTLLAQSLAKEKSRNEQFMVSHRELMTSRNEALMRLNETEASLDRLGALVQTGIRQMQQVASTLGDIFTEICTSKNNPRDSASMRDSWNDTVSPDGHFSGMQENTEVNGQAALWPLIRTSLLPVSPITEESVMMCDGDEIRDNSLICRRDTTPQQPRQLFRDPPEEGPGSSVATNVKVPRKAKVPGYDLGSASFREDREVDRTSLSVVDMDETVANMDEDLRARDQEEDANAKSPVDPSYEQVFCLLKTKERRTVFDTDCAPELTDATPGVGLPRAGASVTPPPCTNNAAHAYRGTSTAAEYSTGPDSPDFRGFSNENTDPTNHIKLLYYGGSSSSDEEGAHISRFLTVGSRSAEKLATPARLSTIPTTNGRISQNNSIDEKPPDRAQTPVSGGRPNSKSSRLTALPTTYLSPRENVSNSGYSKAAVQSKLTKHADPKSAVDNNNSSTAKTPSLSKSTEIRQKNSLEPANNSGRGFEPSKSPAVVLKPLPTTADREMSTRPNAVALSNVLSPETRSTPVRIAGSIKVSSKTTTARIVSNPETKQSPTEVPTRSARNKGSKNRAKRLGLPSKLEGRSLGTPGLTPAKRTPAGTKSADECPRKLTGNTRKAPSKSADPPTLRKKRTKTGANAAGKTASPLRTRSGRVSKRRPSSPDVVDASRTPSRRPEAKTRNVLALVNKLEESTVYAASLPREQEGTERQTRRRGAPITYKEPSLIAKVRRM